MNNINTYRAVITATIEDVETHYEPDYLEPTQVQSSSTITSHSIIGGDTIADHLIREPDTVTLTGKFTKMTLIDLQRFKMTSTKSKIKAFSVKSQRQTTSTLNLLIDSKSTTTWYLIRSIGQKE